MPLPIEEQVVVVTGASSGIGRATALEFSRRGAAVVLAARSEDALRELDREIHEAGGRSYVSVTDVGEWDQVERLADQAVEHFGRIDTWVNNAGVAVYASVEETMPEETERVIRVNLLGEIWGSRAALVKMKAQGSGTIINVSSVLGARSVPLQAAYSASKHGVRGFSEALRVELEADKIPVDVVVIMPSSMNTPFFDHARSKLGVKPQPIPPVYDPQVTAEAIVEAAIHPRRQIVTGGAGRLFTAMQSLTPGMLDRYMASGRRMIKQQRSEEPDDGRDNLFQPSGVTAGKSDGSYGEHAMHSSTYTRVFEQHPMRKKAAAVAGAAGAVFLIRRVAR